MNNLLRCPRVPFPRLALGRVVDCGSPWRGFFVLCGLLSLLVACSAETTDKLRFGMASAPVTLDPRLATDAASARINRLLYDSLVDFDATSAPVPALARWQMLDTTHYRFTLQAQRTFHHGKPLTANDVKATYDYILDKSHVSPHRATLSLIKEIIVVDDRTVDFVIDKPDPLFPNYLVVGIVPADLAAQEHTFNKDPVGSGPFKFIAWPEDGRLVLERVQDAQQVEFLKVPNPTVRVLKMLNGEIDMTQNDLLPELVDYLRNTGAVQVTTGPGINFSYLGFNAEDPVVGKLLVRQAIAYALDRATIIKYVMGETARPASAILPPTHWAGNPGLQTIPYDPDKARALLAQAGFSAAQPARITYKTSNDPFRVRLATVIQHQLRQVGIEVDIRSYDWGTFYGDIKAGRFQMYSLSWVGIKSPDIFSYAFHSKSMPPEGANRGRFRNTEVDHLIDAAQVEPDRDKMAQDYRQLQAILLRELPYVPLWYEDHYVVTRNDIHGYVLAPDGNYDGLITTIRDHRDRLAGIGP